VPARIGKEVRERRGHGPLGEKRTERFAFVEAERRDVDEPDDVPGVAPEGGHDLSAVRVPDDDRRTVLQLEHLPQARNVVGGRTQWELRGPDAETAGCQPPDNAAPAGPLGPSAMNENDVRTIAHYNDSLLLLMQ